MLADEAKTTKGFLKNSLMEGVTAEAEISFDSAIALNSSLQLEAMEKLSEEIQIIFQSQKRKNIGNQGK